MKTKNIKERREKVFEATQFRGAVATFDRVVEVTGFSRNEVAHHLALLKRQDRIVFAEKNTVMRQLTQQELLEGYNEFMYETSHPSHHFGHGYRDPSRRGRQYF